MVLHEHPRRLEPSGGYVRVKNKQLEHRFIMEKTLGRQLHSGEEVHHKNSDRKDNSPSNLELWTKSQPPGSRVSDLVDFVVTRYKKEVLEALGII